MRSRGRGRTARIADPAADDGHDENGFDVVQSGCRRSCQRSDCQRDRCTRRTDGTHYGPHDRAVPDAQPLEGRRDVESAGAVRQDALLGGVAPHTRKHDAPLHLAGCRYGAALRRDARRAGRPHPHGGGVHVPRRGADGRHLPRRRDALRHGARRRGQGRGCRLARDHGVPAPDGLRIRPHEDRHAGTP